MTVVVQVLLEETTQRVPAALHGLAVFVDTLRLLVEAQQSVNAPSVSPQHSLPAQPKDDNEVLGTATPMEEDQPEAMLAQNADDAGAAAMNPAEAKRPKELSPSAGIAVDALISNLNRSVWVTMSFEIVISASHDVAHAILATCIHKPGLAAAVWAVCQLSVMAPRSSQPQCMSTSIYHCQSIMHLDQQLPALQMRNQYIYSFHVLISS